jgi:uncharacterized spore protein YtfJ
MKARNLMNLHTANNPTGGFVDRLAASVGGRAGAASVFGDPVERDGLTVIPVAAARFAFGGGAGPSPDGKGEGGGGGGGAASRPLGFIEISAGRARFRRITDPIAVAVGMVAVAAAVAIVARAAGRLAGGCRMCARRRDEQAEADHTTTSKVTIDENVPTEHAQ